jgi:hypothetical protein
MSFGYALGAAGSSAARDARLDQPGPEPLPPGVDPLTAIDPELRELILSTDAPTDAETPEPTGLSDRIRASLMGAGIGAATGFLLLNGLGGRGARTYRASPMNPHATLAWMGAGSAIGAIAGFSSGRSPLEPKPKQAPPEIAPASTLPTDPNAPAHPAFAALHGQG